MGCQGRSSVNSRARSPSNEPASWKCGLTRTFLHPEAPGPPDCHRHLVSQRHSAGRTASAFDPTWSFSRKLVWCTVYVSKLGIPSFNSRLTGTRIPQQVQDHREHQGNSRQAIHQKPPTHLPTLGFTYIYLQKRVHVQVKGFRVLIKYVKTQNSFPLNCASQPSYDGIRGRKE